MGCGINKTNKPTIISRTSLNSTKNLKLSNTFTKKKNYKNLISHKSWLNILDFLSYNEIKEIGKTNKLFNFLVKQNKILVKFFKKKNNLKNTKSCSKNLIFRPSDSTIKKNIKFYESFALLQINQKCESIDSNYSTSSERLVV
jgi:hypothetical protein